MRWRPVAGCLFLLPSLAAAQGRSWPVRVACDSGVVPRYEQTMLQLHLDVPALSDTVARQRSRRVADAVTKAFVLRSPIVLPRDVVWQPPAPAVSSAAAPTAPSPVQSVGPAAEPPSSYALFAPLSGNLTIRFDSASSGPDAVTVDSTTFAESLREALVTAVRQAATNGAFDAIGAAPVSLLVRASPTAGSSAVALHRMEVTYLPLEATVAARTPIRPAYPQSLLRSDIEGYVDVAFTVLPTGVAAQPVVLRASHPEFGGAVVTALAPARFRPARAGGCAVSSPVRQRVQFRLGQ